jgi:enoyl-CoA hydratase/carnithine racemase
MIDWTFKDGIYELALGNPPCNELGTRMIEDLERFLDQIDIQKGRALIIYSTLDRGFCAGADLRELYAGLVDRPESEHVPGITLIIEQVHRVMNKLDLLPLTTVGAINGLCFGGGFELALTCDILVADRDARFSFPELRLGLIPGFGGIPRLKREVPNAMVRDLLFTGRSIGAKRAAEVGLVSQVVGTGQALTVARQVARQLTLFDRDTVRVAKFFIKPIPSQELEEEKKLFLELIQRPFVKEALGRFVRSRDHMPYLPQGMREEGSC